ncbi:MAG: efflux RND transporter periplasmic adaptor subunit [Candidatus Atribacteria bacterium]|nr:efflux RND transporter periplasmic adaptor subunit [Candidatus Atribacteria bacterium]
MKKWLIWLLIILILGVGIYFGKGYLIQIMNTNPDSGISAEEIDLEAAVTVTKGSIRETVSTSGYIQPENQVHLSFASTGTTGGTVEKIFVETGNLVEQGQALVKLEDKQEHLSYLKARNEYELAKISGSPSEIEEKKLTMEVALDNYESKTLKAPFSGKIVEIFIEEGDFIEGSDDVIYLIDDSSYEVEVSVSEVDCLKVEVGQKVEIELDILENQVFSGEVAEVSEYANTESGVVTVPVTVLLDEVSPYFKPGFSATAEIIVHLVENVVVIPVTAISKTNKGSMVLKVDHNQAMPTMVKIGISDGYYQEVTEGLQEGDWIIVNNYQMNSTSGSRDQGFGGSGVRIPMMRP